MSLKTAFAVGGTYSFVPSNRVIAIAIFATALVVINFIFGFKVKKPEKTHFKVIIKAIPAALCVCVLVGVASFISRQDIRDIIPEFNATLFTPASMAKDDGLVLSFVSTIQYTQVDKPSGYSKEKVKSILDKNRDDSIWNTSKVSKTVSNSPVIKTKTKKANVVVIMNECFSDIGVLGNLKTNQDYMPFTHQLMKGNKNTISGYFYSSVLAGSTANTELEFLTGDSMAFLPPASIPYQQFIHNKTDSMASYLDKQDYHTMGTHPYVSYGWNRVNVYPLMGFKGVKFARDMTGLNKIRVYTDDESYYNYLENNIFYQKEPFFSFNVTMQNHGGYTGTYDNFNVDIHMQNSASQTTDNYLSLIKKSDDSFKKLIDYFKKHKEPTIVVMFGDHQPNDYVVEAQYNLVGKTVSQLKGAERFERYKVPVIIWANYDIPEDTNLLTSANYMGGIVQKLAGCKTSPYQNFLEKLRSKVPVISSQGYIGADGKYRDLDTLDDYSNMIEDYKTLNYYNIFEENDIE